MPTKPWKEIREKRSKLSPSQRAKIDEDVLINVARMRLPDLRRHGSSRKQLSRIFLICHRATCRV